MLSLGLMLTSCGGDSNEKSGDKSKETKADADNEDKEEERRPGPEMGLHFEEDGEDEFGVPKNLLFATTSNGTVELGELQGHVAEVDQNSYKIIGIPANAVAAIGVKHMHEFFVYGVVEGGELKIYSGSPMVGEDKVKQWREIRPELIGRWENKEDDNFWAYYDLTNVYGDGNEEGTYYEVKGDQITYGVGKDASKMKIVKLTYKEFVITYPEGGTQSSWVKADF